MTRRQISCLHRMFHRITALLAVCVVFLATPGVTHAQTVRGVVMGQPGDRWLDAIQYTQIERLTINEAFGYAITYDIPEAGRLILFWPRSAIDLEGKDPSAERLVMDIPGGHLYYPETLTARSLPKVYDGILWLERKYRADARGGMAAAQAFAVVFASAEAAPALVTVSTRLLTVRSAGRVVTVLEEKVPSVAATTNAATTSAAEASTSAVVSATPAGAMAQPVAASAARSATTTATTAARSTAAKGSSSLAAAQGARPGRLIIAEGRKVSEAEMAIAQKLVGEGRTVKVLAESTKEGKKSADFLVDGIKTELKTVSKVTAQDGNKMATVVKRTIDDASEQASHIIVDVRDQARMTAEIATDTAKRALGADKDRSIRRIQQIRMIGKDFDLTFVPEPG